MTEGGIRHYCYSQWPLGVPHPHFAQKLVFNSKRQAYILSSIHISALCSLQMVWIQCDLFQGFKLSGKEHSVVDIELNSYPL